MFIEKIQLIFLNSFKFIYLFAINFMLHKKFQLEIEYIFFAKFSQ